MRVMWWLLLPALLLSGCASRPGETAMKGADLNFTNDVERPGPFEKLSQGVAIRLAAESWPALMEKTKPTFAWNGCDLMWIATNETGRLRFVLDEAYEYHPTNQPPQFVLLDEVNVPYDEAFQAIMGHNLHAVAELHRTVPEPEHDTGGRGDYAVEMATHPEFGTVYEIGWQRLMSGGTGHYDFGRRLYVLKDKDGRWHFLGKGPEEGNGRGIMVNVNANVKWDVVGKVGEPFRIQFVEQSTGYYAYEQDPEEPAVPNLTVNTDWVLAGPFPARLKSVSKRNYLLAEKGDTLKKIVERLIVWRLVLPMDEPPGAEISIRKLVFAAWKKELIRLNPKIVPDGVLAEGTRVEMLADDEAEKLMTQAKKACEKF